MLSAIQNRRSIRRFSDRPVPRELVEEEQIGRRLKEIGRVCMRRGEKDNLSAIYVKTIK